MVRLDFLIFGYRRLTFESARERAKCSSALMRSGVPHVSVGEFDILIREREYLKNTKYITEQNCKISDKPKGLLPFFKDALKAKLSLLAALISVLMIFLAPSVVWDVRVSGCERLSSLSVEAALSDLGLRVGASWRSFDASETEILLLDSCPDIAWVAINRLGSVAYVEIVEASLPKAEGEPTAYSNVVATKDAVIRDIIVTSGYATVEVGDVVRRGEVLISGIPPKGTEGGFCHAEGVVIGECDEEISVEIPRVTVEKELGEGAKSGITLKILNFSLNIFKIYRNYGRECVIIENNEKCRLFGKYEIPVEIVTEYTIPTTERSITHTDAELVALASEEMREAILAKAMVGELLRLRTSGGYTTDGYAMKTTITVIEPIGEDSAIAVE